MKTGLVLEGGGVRGIYTAGVLDVFLEEDITFDGVIGVSAGAIHGCSYLSKQKGRSIRYFKKYCQDPRFMSMKSWLKTGDIVGADFCYREIPDKLDPFDHEACARRTGKFYATVTNVDTGQAEHIELDELHQGLDYVRASASLPYFSRFVEIDGKRYLDGGCADSVPVKSFMDLGYGRNVVVLTKEAGYRKKPEMPLLTKLKYGRYPAFAKALLNRAEDYNRCMDEIDQLANEGKVFVIQPTVKLDIGRADTDPDKIQAAYDQGVADAKALVEDLKAWLKTMHPAENP